MRKKLILVLIFAFAVQPAVALADGPSGSKEDKKNQVKCAEGTDTPAGKVYAADNGVESCSDDNSAPDGRIIVDFEGEYIAADGDTDNGDESNGFIRLDESGPSCGTDKKTDSTKGSGDPCGAFVLGGLSGNFAQFSFQVLHLIP